MNNHEKHFVKHEKFASQNTCGFKLHCVPVGVAHTCMHNLLVVWEQHEAAEKDIHINGLST